MKISIILLILLGAMFTGCVSNPIKEVPVVKVNITYQEKNGIVEAMNYTITQGKVAYIDRPRMTQAKSFPAIGARITIMKGKNSTIGPWEMVTYTGNGTYSFNIGFDETRYPSNNDTVHISIIVVDTKGERIGYVVDNIIWKE